MKDLVEDFSLSNLALLPNKKMGKSIKNNEQTFTSLERFVRQSCFLGLSHTFEQRHMVEKFLEHWSQRTWLW